MSLGTHWICSYYDTKKISIYDSLNTKILSKCQEEFLKKLFPTYDFIKNSVTFFTVQQQLNASDCGVFAIAFAVSLLFNIKPDKVRYDYSLMRSHLVKMFETNVIEHFPQDLNFGVLQKVLSLREIRAKEAKATRIRTIRQHKMEQLKSNLLPKNCDFYISNKGINNNFLKTQSILKGNIQLITNDINIEQINKWSQSEFYVEDITDYKSNDLYNDNNQDKVYNYDIKDYKNKNANKYLQYEHSKVKNITEEKQYKYLKNYNTKVHQ